MFRTRADTDPASIMSRTSDTRSVSLRKVTFQIDQGGSPRMSGREGSAGGGGVEGRAMKPSHVLLAFLALLLVWVLYVLPIVGLSFQPMEVSGGRGWCGYCTCCL